MKEELNTLTTDNLNKYLLSVIPQTEQDRVFNQDKCDIDHNFPGFIDTYYHLSRIIPEDYTIIDFGAAYNAQSYFFVNHSRYIAVTPLVKEAFKPDNCTVYKLTTGEFLSQVDYPKDKVFAICNYVPGWFNEDSIKLVKEHFRNCYCFYPQ
jgi:hypothetical protein